MNKGFASILRMTSAIVSISKFRLMADMQTRSYMGTYWSWLSARPHTHQVRGSSSVATQQTPGLMEALVHLQRSWWFADFTVQSSPYRRIADSFGLSSFPSYSQATLS